MSVICDYVFEAMQAVELDGEKLLDEDFIMSVTVVAQYDPDFQLQFHVLGCLSVYALKSRVSYLWKYGVAGSSKQLYPPAEDIDLFLHGVKLRDDNSLWISGVRNDSDIMLILKRRGG